MSNEEIRKELIHIIKGSYRNDYMWYYDGYKSKNHSKGFPVFESLIELINKLGSDNDKPLPYDIYDIVHGEY